ncbi:MAG: cell wall hydrolase [Caenispirillum sp.]|nr:cell wall hydrolase [Caenispirillum sp.]
MSTIKASPLDIDTLARTLYGEARGEGQIGMIAVAHVVLNRVKRPGWWTRERGDGIPDDTIAAGCRDPWQFSCWNANDPNRDKLLAVDLNDPVFHRCYFVALGVVIAAQGFDDPTQGATHYHAASTSPPWARGRVPVVSIGRHKFYTGIP